MPAEFEGWVNQITRTYVQKGISPKRAKNIAYATATKMWHKKYPGKKLH